VLIGTKPGAHPASDDSLSRITDKHDGAYRSIVNVEAAYRRTKTTSRRFRKPAILARRAPIVLLFVPCPARVGPLTFYWWTGSRPVGIAWASARVRREWSQ